MIGLYYLRVRLMQHSSRASHIPHQWSCHFCPVSKKYCIVHHVPPPPRLINIDGPVDLQSSCQSKCHATLDPMIISMPCHVCIATMAQSVSIFVAHTVCLSILPFPWTTGSFMPIFSLAHTLLPFYTLLIVCFSCTVQRTCVTHVRISLLQSYRHLGGQGTPKREGTGQGAIGHESNAVVSALFNFLIGSSVLEGECSVGRASERNASRPIINAKTRMQVPV